MRTSLAVAVLATGLTFLGCGDAIVPATGEEISPVTSWLLRAPVTASRSYWLTLTLGF